MCILEMDHRHTKFNNKCLYYILQLFLSFARKVKRDVMGKNRERFFLSLEYDLIA